MESCREVGLSELERIGHFIDVAQLIIALGSLNVILAFVLLHQCETVGKVVN